MTVKRSNIGYCDFSGGDLNFVIRGKKGDCECSSECDNCYALAILEQYGNTPEHTKVYPEKLARLRNAKFQEKDTPFRRGKDSRPILFAVDMGDLFHPLVPDDFIQSALDVMKWRIDVDWLVLTKRAQRLVKFSYPSNVWLGVTIGWIESSWRVNWLLETDARVKWISMEPMLSDLNLISRYTLNKSNWVTYRFNKVNWIALGAESGISRRMFNPDWARYVRDFCQDEGIAFFYKQGSHRFPGRDDILDGRKWKEFPE